MFAKKLRNKFIFVCMLAVSLVMVFLCVIINSAVLITTENSLKSTLDRLYITDGVIPPSPRMQSEVIFNAETIPSETEIFAPPGQYGDLADFRFDRETRFFLLKFDSDGNLTEARLQNITAVTEDDVLKFLNVAIKKKSGYGTYSGYKYLVKSEDGIITTAIFLDYSKEKSFILTTLFLSVCSLILVLFAVFVLLFIFSKKAIEPFVKNAEKQKQFVTDAGHELKTPITVINTSLKVLEMEVGKQKWIDKALSQTEKLTELVNGLVTLAKTDELSSRAEFKKFDIAKAFDEAAESFSDYAAASGRKLNYLSPDSLYYLGDEYSVRRLLSVLIENAVKYSPRDTTISISLEKTKHGVVIKESSACKKTEEAELDKLFNRFYRSDSARYEQKSGFGIGLAIAKNVAQNHNGDIKAALSEDGKTITFTVNLN